MPWKKKLILVLTLFCVSISVVAHAEPDVISLFPLNDYDQKVSDWIKPDDVNFDKPLLSEKMQDHYLSLFIKHYYGESSPWNEVYVNKILQQSSPDDLRTVQLGLLDNFSNQGKSENQIGYGENFRPHDNEWINKIAHNINLDNLNGLNYLAANRGIAIDNLHARALPTNDVHYYSHKLAGQGYPFDNLQMSALWAGTPVYTIAQTRDKAWSLVIAPDYVAWVESKGIAHADNGFIASWSSAAKNHLAAITKTQSSLIDEQGEFLFTAYIGSVFPALDNLIMVPAQDSEHNAVIKNVAFNHNMAIMPLKATPHAFAKLMNSMIGRPYGWGSLYFFNDCSAEMKSLMTPFGIWLPRHSADQVSVGKMTDLTSESPRQRLDYLINNGRPLMNLIYIGGHVILYVGKYPNPRNNNELMAMTYQNLWGLSPNPSNRRAVVGQSVLFPMLLEYPEDGSLISLANKRYFQVSDLTQLADNTMQPASKLIDLKSLMTPSLLFKG